MSLIDSTLVFSDAQDVKADAISSNTLDFGGARNRNLGEVYWVIKVTTAVADGAVRATLISNASAAPASLYDGTAHAEIYIPAGTAAGSVFCVAVPTNLILQYVGVWYEDVADACSAANVDSYLLMHPLNPQANFQVEPS